MNTSDSRKNKWIAGGAVLVMLLAGGSILRIRSLQRQAAPGDLKAQQKAMVAAVDARLALSPAEQARRLELVTHLRDTWKIWAEKHQPELRRMLNAKSSDAAARDAVWNAIPGAPYLSEDPKDLRLYDALNMKRLGANGEVFTWHAGPKREITRNSRGEALSADEKDRGRRGEAQAQWGLQNDFAEWRDINISHSLQTGRISVSLWVSGRVTEDTTDNRDVRSPKGFGVFTYKRKELMPPYDFLTSK